MKKKGYHYILESPQYQNCEVLNPDGHLMFRCSYKKANWYLERNLAVKLKDEPLVVKLLFTPNGNGHIGDPYHLQVMQNKCAVCGNAEDLTRHHIVPYCYRRYFPDEIKNHRAYDVMAMCTNCHHAYETQAECLKKEIGEEYGMPVGGMGAKYDKKSAGAKTAAHAILQHASKMPPARLEELYERVRVHLGREATIDDLQQLTNKNLHDFRDYVHHGKYVVSKIPTDGIEEFIRRWRKHFLETMQPRFMPNNWTVERSVWHK
jgi:hypothetical protein